MKILFLHHHVISISPLGENSQFLAESTIQLACLESLEVELALARIPGVCAQALHKGALIKLARAAGLSRRGSGSGGRCLRRRARSKDGINTMTRYRRARAPGQTLNHGSHQRSAKTRLLRLSRR